MDALTKGLLAFLQHSPSPYHAVAQGVARLEQAGFKELDLRRDWKLKPGQGYYVKRGGGSLIAWRQGQTPGFHLVGSHTDSPGLKLKPLPDLHREGCHSLGVEVYGGPLLATWFDRELSLAGRLELATPQGVQDLLLDLQKPLALIPNLAIHLNRDANKGWEINKQTELPPLVQLLSTKAKPGFLALLLKEAKKQLPQAQEILSHDLFFYPNAPPGLAGWNNELIMGYRLDNLLSCYAGLQALLAGPGAKTQVLVWHDHEEVGSVSYHGADGPFLLLLLERMAGGRDAYAKAVADSLMISVDNAHGVHPNHSAKHEPNHLPRLNGGPVIKHNANQRYATDAATAAQVAMLAKQAKVTLQQFVIRSDLTCGSTIGPVTASQTGIPVLDLGLAQWAMHSARECAGAKDFKDLIKLLAAFYQSPA